MPDNQSSRFVNSIVLARPGECSLATAAYEGTALFQFSPDGASIRVNLEEMLVAPLELFSQRQIKLMQRRLRQLSQGQTGNTAISPGAG